MNRRRVVFGLLGYAIVFLGVFYFAAAAAVSTVVDWPNTLSAAFVFSPIGLFAAALPDLLKSVRP